MARVPMVTRTISSTTAKVLVVNITTKQTSEKEVTVPRTPDEKHLMKAVEAAINNEEEKAVTILSSEVVETLYGMEETEFIKVAAVLPPRGTQEDSEKEPEAEKPATKKAPKSNK